MCSKKMNKKYTDLNKTEISNLPDREYKITVIKMFAEAGRTMHEQNEIFNKEIENIKSTKE